MTSTLRSDLRTVARGWRWSRRPLVPRSAERFAPPVEAREFPTEWARTPVGRTVREVVQRCGLAPLVHSQVDLQVHGLDILADLRPPVLFVANHASHLDAPLILCALPEGWRRRTAVAAAADYFFDAWWRAIGSALTVNTFPIERQAGRMTNTAGELLDEGWNVVVFPEGTRSPDGWMGEFRRGAAWLAAAHDVPVVPIAIRGAYAAMPRGRNWPVPGRPPVHLRFGRPIVPTGRNARLLAPAVSAAVSALMDEDRSTWWAAARRAAAGTTPSPAGPPAARWRRVWAATAPPSAPVERVWRRG